MAERENLCSYSAKGKFDRTKACVVLYKFFSSVSDMIRDMEASSEEMKKIADYDYMTLDMFARQLEDLKNTAMAIGRAIAEMPR